MSLDGARSPAPFIYRRLASPRMIITGVVILLDPEFRATYPELLCGLEERVTHPESKGEYPKRTEAPYVGLGTNIRNHQSRPVYNRAANLYI